MNSSHHGRPDAVAARRGRHGLGEHFDVDPVADLRRHARVRPPRDL